MSIDQLLFRPLQEYLEKKRMHLRIDYLIYQSDDPLKKLSVLPLYINGIKKLKMFYSFRNRGSKSI